MATKEKDTNKELEVEEIVSKSEQFIENNSKKIIYGIIAVALVVGAVLGIKHGYLVPQEKKAAAAMFKGEQRTLTTKFHILYLLHNESYLKFSTKNRSILSKGMTLI